MAKSAWISLFAPIVGILLLAGCGGGTTVTTPTPTPTAPAVTVSGKVTFVTYPATFSNGLDYANPLTLPARGVWVALRDAAANDLVTGVTDANGDYSLSFTSGTPTTVVALARFASLGAGGGPLAKVVDNTQFGSQYGITLAVDTSAGSVTANLNAASGWDGTAYTSPRASAPFAILDVAYQARKLVESANPNVLLNDLTINWSTQNIPTSGILTLGQIGTSHFSPTTKQLFILGAEDLDTDEFDDHVIAHEWWHYFEFTHSRADNMGGPHGQGDLLDPAVAFSEGMGDAFSGMATNDPDYLDTGGFGQAITGLHLPLDADTIADTAIFPGTSFPLDGIVSEISIQEVAFDLFDGGPNDDDPVSLGFTPIYQAMISFKSFSGFTTISGLLSFIKEQAGIVAADIDAVAAAENIGIGDAFEPANDRQYTTLPLTGTPVSVDLFGTTLQTFSLFSLADFPPGNKLYNWRWFRYTAASTGCYTVNAVPTISSDDLIIGQIDGVSTDAGLSGPETFTRFSTAGEIVVFRVGSFSWPVGFTVDGALNAAVSGPNCL